MWRRAFVVYFLLLLMSLFLHGERPYFGIESDFFFPIGDWAEEADFSRCFKVSVKKYFTKEIGGELSLGYLSFNRSFREDAKLSMFPIIYFDIYAEQHIGESVFYVGISLGPNYTNQKVTYDGGEESGGVNGWSTGTYIILRKNFFVGPLVRFRYIKRADTDGIELAVGVSL